MRGMKTPQQDVALKIQGDLRTRGAYLRDTTVLGFRDFQRRYDTVTSLQGLNMRNYCGQVQLFSVLEAFYFQFSLTSAQALVLWML